MILAHHLLFLCRSIDILYRAGHYRYFLLFSLIKNDFLHYLSSKFDWEWAFKIGLMQKYVVNLIKNAKKSFFIVEKIQKYRKCPALDHIQFSDRSKILEGKVSQGITCWTIEHCDKIGLEMLADQLRRFSRHWQRFVPLTRAGHLRFLL